MAPFPTNPEVEKAMWLCLNDSFLSIVHKECGPDELLVRARRLGDIEKVFPKAKVRKSPSTDYLFRAVVKRSEVGAALARLADDIDYDNFKNSVGDDKLHSAYAAIWHTMSRLQPTPPYSSSRKHSQGALL